MLNQWIKTTRAYCAETGPKLWALLTCHRAFYLGLGTAHANGCWMTEYPQLYAPMALLYVGLALRG